MQAANNTQHRQAAATAASPQQQGAKAVDGPTLIAPELLQLVGGGKSVAAPTASTNLPVGKW